MHDRYHSDYIDQKDEMKAKISLCKAKIDEKNLIYYQAMVRIMNQIGFEA